MASPSGKYSLEDLEAYGRRLNGNTALAVIINGFAAWIVLKYSTPIMGKYKYYILLTIGTTFVMDFHVTAIYGLYPLFPFPGSCGAGLFRNFGFFWGEFIHYVSFLYIKHKVTSASRFPSLF